MKRRNFIAGLGAATATAAAAPVLRPRSARAQSALPVIGILSGQSEGGNPGAIAAFRKGLGEQGYFEGRNVEILYRWAATQYDRLPALAADLVHRQVAIIVTGGGAAPLVAARKATATIPIVFITGSDPVERGFVASLSHPGGNATGVALLFQTVVAKRLELLREIVPAATVFAFLANPTAADSRAQIREAETAARILGVHLAILNTSTASEINAAFRTIAEQQIGALAVSSDVLFFNEADHLAELATIHRLPTIYHTREIVDAGGLMSYGASISDGYRVAGTYAGRILKGEKPADLPVQQSIRIETVVNLKAAKAIGLAIPTETLLRADEVIE
jgi:putative tryptophan/tyrosine transport system substrate-binding protein